MNQYGITRFLSMYDLSEIKKKLSDDFLKNLTNLRIAGNTIDKFWKTKI